MAVEGYTQVTVSNKSVEFVSSNLTKITATISYTATRNAGGTYSFSNFELRSVGYISGITAVKFNNVSCTKVSTHWDAANGGSKTSTTVGAEAVSVPISVTYNGEVCSGSNTVNFKSCAFSSGLDAGDYYYAAAATSATASVNRGTGAFSRLQYKVIYGLGTYSTESSYTTNNTYNVRNSNIAARINNVDTNNSGYVSITTRYTNGTGAVTVKTAIYWRVAGYTYTSSPSLSITPSSSTTCLQGITKFTITPTAPTAMYSATWGTPKIYGIVEGVEKLLITASSYSNKTIPWEGSVQFKVVYTDNRGKQASYTSSDIYTILHYDTPILDYTKVRRCGQSLQDDPLGSYLKIDVALTRLTVNTTVSGTYTVNNVTQNLVSHTWTSASSTIEHLLPSPYYISLDVENTATINIHVEDTNGAAADYLITIGKGFAYLQLGGGSGYGIGLGSISSADELEVGLPLRITPTYYGSESITDTAAINIYASHALRINGVTQPYLISSGTSDIWYWEKWSNGIAKCWGTKEVTVTRPATATAVSGSNVAYPTDLFTSGLSGAAGSIPTLSFTAQCKTKTASTAALWYTDSNTAAPSLQQTGAFGIYWTTSGVSATYILQYSAIGRWQ